MQTPLLHCQGHKIGCPEVDRELLSSLDHGIDLPHGRILINDWLQRWLSEQVRPNQRQSEYRRYAPLHGAPVDYWRYSNDALAGRRDLRGRGTARMAYGSSR